MDQVAGCQNLYRLIRDELGLAVSDREIARRWGIPWRSFLLLKRGERKTPSVEHLAALARLLELEPAIVFEVARGEPVREARRKFSKLGPGTKPPTERPHLRIDGVAEPIVTVDTLHRIWEANPPFEALTGRTQSELLGTPIVDLAPESEAQRIGERLGHALAGATPRRMGFPVLDAEGRVRATDASIARLTNGRARPNGLQLLIWDRSEEAAGFRRLERATSYWRALVENAPDRVGELDLAGRFTSVDGAGASPTRAAFASVSIFDCALHEHHADIRATLARVIEGRGCEQLRVACREEGAVHQFQFRFSPRIHRGAVVAFIYVARAVTSARSPS